MQTPHDTAAVAGELNGLVAAAASRGTVSRRPTPHLSRIQVACVTLRATGKRVGSAWLEGNVADGLAAAVSEAASGLPDGGTEALSTVEVTVPFRWTRLLPDDLTRQRCNDFRGVFGIELRSGGRIARLGPLELIARNLSPQRAFELLVDEIGVHSVESEVYWFAADQYLVEVHEARCLMLGRGQPVVAQAAITHAGVDDMATSMTKWLVAQVGTDGKTTYKYWPSSGTYSDANNTIRQFMASACLAVAARRKPALEPTVRRNFKHNFATFYREEGGLGFIDEFGKVKLGAAAVAVTAILNLADPEPWRRQLDGLRAFIEAMQNDDGSFRTFLKPPGRNDNQNFYPGEAALALARLNAERPEHALVERLRACFAYYRDWHRVNLNPAFVPWHTKAYCLLHAFTRDQPVADFVFEMNDWLLGIQQVENCPPDVIGEFFDPERPQFGPPHASATGVYLEGLVDAWRLARDLGDRGRTVCYQRAIVRGLRSLRQLQFRDGADMFYIRRCSRVRGAVRSSGFDNTIRLDNVQHGLMAMYELLDLFGEDDFVV